MHHSYVPAGVCSRRIEFDIAPDGTIHSLTFAGGCHGNTQGLCSLAEGMDAAELTRRLRGIDCKGKGTSCPDQLAAAVAAALARENHPI